MYVWQHAASSLVFSYLIVSYYGMDILTGLVWILLGFLAGTLIDLDHIIYSIMTRGKKAIKFILREMYVPRKLMGEYTKGGKLYYPDWSRSIFHFITSLLVFLIFLNFFPNYSLIVGLNLLLHQILDINLRWFRWKY